MTELFLILTLLFFKHLIIDFVLQTQKQVDEKGIYGAPGGIEHSGQHAVATFLVFFWFVGWPIAVVLAVIDGLLHYHIDWAKMKYGKKKNYTPADRGFWFLIGLDQFAHSLTYLWLVWILV